MSAASTSIEGLDLSDSARRRLGLQSWFIPLQRAATLVLMLGLVVLAGCAGGPRLSSGVAHLQSECRNLILESRQAVARAGAGDALGYPLKSFPYLRSTRFLASFADELGIESSSVGEQSRVGSRQAVQRQAWLADMRRLGDQARAFELANLPPAARLDSARRQRLEDCINNLAVLDQERPDFWTRLRRDAQVPEEYQTWKRLLGLFPLSRLVVLARLESAQETWRAELEKGVDDKHPLFLYRPQELNRPEETRAVTRERLAAWLQSARQRHPLGWPQLSARQLQAVFARHAPVWRIAQASSADRPGALEWVGDSVRVDARRPVVYQLPSFTRLQGKTLLQLNYVLWFQERPPAHWLDIYAGWLDAIIWRVTLMPDGHVLGYDSIHSCGCYHLMAPGAQALVPKPPLPLVERPLILPRLAKALDGQRPLISLRAGDHFIQGIDAWSSNADKQQADKHRRYRLVDYHQLRSLPVRGQPGVRRGLFDDRGLVPSSRRPERWLLWPMGVASPGAMRIWGRQPVSFANRRHFDDPDLWPSLFRWWRETESTEPRVPSD